MPEIPFPNVLHYYAPPQTVINVLGTHTLRASNVYEMQDEDEMVRAYDLMLEVLKEHYEARSGANRFKTVSLWLIKWFERRFSPKSTPQVFVRSLSAGDDAIDMWDRFADGCTGGRLSLSMHKVLEIANHCDMKLVKCVYEELQQRDLIGWLHGRFIQASSIGPDGKGKLPSNNTEEDQFAQFDEQIDLTAIVLAQLKRPAYRSENEWRLVSRWLPSSDPRILNGGERYGIQNTTYINLKLMFARPTYAQVALGPKIDDATSKQVAEMLDQNQESPLIKSTLKVR
jgi:hypothetical protein